MRAALSFLSLDEVQALHSAALRILVDLGVRMPGKEASRIMQDGGARVEDEIVHIPPDLVQWALDQVPKRSGFRLCGRDTARDVVIDVDGPVLAAMTEATHVTDPTSRERRPARLDDLVLMTRFANHLEHVGVNSAPVTPQDVPGHLADWHTWAAGLKNTAKHITGAAPGAQAVRDVAEMASIAVGGEDRFRERPNVSFWALTRPPLQVDLLTVEALIEMSRWKIPAIISSGPIMGMTAPVTIAGVVAQAHAEILSCIVLTQLVTAGTPVMYTSFARSMDMLTAGVSMSSPEFALLKGAMAQMGQFIGLPIRMPAMLKDAKTLDAQAGFENGTTGLVSSMCADVIDAMQFDMDIVVDYADFVFCNEIMGALRRISRGITVSDATVAVDVLSEVGRTGNFLAHQHTLQRFREEMWQPQLLERRSWAAWERDGSRTIDEICRDRANVIMQASLDDHVLPDEQQREIDAALDRQIRLASA